MSSNDNMHYDNNCFSCFLQGFSLLNSDTTNKSSEHYKAASTHSFESWGLSLLTTSSQPLPHYPRQNGDEDGIVIAALGCSSLETPSSRRSSTSNCILDLIGRDVWSSSRRWTFLLDVVVGLSLWVN